MALTALGLLLTLKLYQHGYLYEPWGRYTLNTLGFSTVGLVVASRRPENAVGWIFCAIGFLGAVQCVSAEYYVYTLFVQPGSLSVGEAMAWVRSWLWVPYEGLYLFLGLLFPHGRLPSPRWRWYAWLLAVMIVIGAIAEALLPGRVYQLESTGNPLGIENLESINVDFGPFAAQFRTLGALFGLGVVIALLSRFQRSRGAERQQLKWFVYSGAVLAVGYLLFLVLPEEATNTSWLPRIGSLLLTAGFAAIPVAMGIAIMKFHLYDIDVIINRTLVYVALTASVVGLYVLVVGTLSTLFQASGNVAVSLLATGVVAVVFAPLRARLQRSVNRLMFGERDDPYAVLSSLGERLEATSAPKAALTTITETITQALRVPYVAIALSQDDGKFSTVAEHGRTKGEPVALPLVYHRETIGRLVVAPRAPGEVFSPADIRLLEDLARQVEVTVHAFRVTADLQRSRERLVSAREEERRRLRRDLHDGLGPTLGALTLGLDTTRLALVEDDPKVVDELLLELKSQTQEAVSDVRRLVYGLRPPALDDLGLIPAIRQQAGNHGLLAEELRNGTATSWTGKNGLVFTVEAVEDLSSLPAAVEVACYRIAQEAINNAARHSGASSCLISLSLDETEGTLQLEVADNGTGIPEGRSAGVGMSSMRERAEELGGTLSVGALPEGGTRVLARLPLPARET